MDNKLLIASGAIGGLITSALAPWVKHRIKRNEDEKSRKRQLISDWRQMIIEIAREAREPNEIRALLQSHPAFLSLEPHLTEEARRSAYARNFTVASGVTVPYSLHVIKEDINRIEKSWGLHQ